MTAQIKSRGGRCIEKPFDIHLLARVVNGVAAGEGNGDERDSAGGPSGDE